jgi:hypothetical protein
MTRPSKKTIEPLLGEWARLEARRINIERKRDCELAMHKAAFEKKTAPILLEAKTRLDSINARLALLAGNSGAQ